MAKYIVSFHRSSDGFQMDREADTIRDARQLVSSILQENKITNWLNAGEFAKDLRVGAPATFLGSYTFAITRK